MLSVRCLSVCPVCKVGVLWPNCWTDPDETWHAGRPRPWPHCVRWGPSSPSPKGAYPRLSAHICCGQFAGWIKMPLRREVGLDPNDIVLDGYPAPLPEKGAESPPISAHVYCAKTAGWIKMPLDKKVGLSPDRIVLHRDPTPPS